MPLRSRRAWIAVLIFSMLPAVCGRAAEFSDSAGRRVMLPDRIDRIMPADQAAAVLIFVLVPQKLVGWSRALSRLQRAYLPARYARLPVVGELGGAFPTADAATVARSGPDLIVYSGVVSPAAAALADRIQMQTRIPFIVLDGSIQRTPEMLRAIGLVFGAGDHRLDVGSYAYHAIQGLRGKLLIQEADNRPRVYYGLDADGLTTGLAGAVAMAVIDQAGAVNVAGQLGPGELTRVTLAQIYAWNPDIIIAQRRSFYAALRRDAEWTGLAAVHDKHVYLAPQQPFGWLDDPAGVNRMVGLYWLSDLFYPNVLEEDLRTDVRAFYQTFYGVTLTDRQLDALIRPAAPASIATSGTATVGLFEAEPTPEPGLSPRGTQGMVPLAPPGRGGGQAVNPPGGAGNPQ
jgi:iron complex transport system substrate-binding protein